MSRLQVLIIVIATAAAAGGCATTGATPAPFPRPAPAAPPGAPPGASIPGRAPGPGAPTGAPGGAAGAVAPGATATGYELAGTALSLRGTPYKNGGADPAGFDCSGFVRYVFGQHGIPVPRSVGGLWQAGREVIGNQLEPGDLVFFSTVSPGASHVGIAIGGNEFVHAPSSTGVVRVERISASYWATRFVGARRVL
jgi:cell wall-associated NlpC family hydrolase